MNRSLILLSVSLALIACGSRAQEVAALSLIPDTTGRLGQTEETLGNALQSVSWALQMTAAQTVAALTALVPEHPFTRFAVPFMCIVRDAIRASMPRSWQLFRYLDSVLIAAIEASR